MPMGNQQYLLSGRIIDIAECHRGKTVFLLQEGTGQTFTTHSWWFQQHSWHYFGKSNGGILLVLHQTISQTNPHNVDHTHILPDNASTVPPPAPVWSSHGSG